MNGLNGGINDHHLPDLQPICEKQIATWTAVSLEELGNTVVRFLLEKI